MLRASRKSGASSTSRPSRRSTNISRICRRRGSSSARGTAAGRSRWYRTRPAAARSNCRCSGYVAAGAPIEAVVGNETIAVPEDLVGKRETYVLRVKGDSMIDEQIRDGDFVIVEDRRTADNGEMVIAMVNGSDVTLKKLYREQGRIRLQPANPAVQPIVVPRRSGRRSGRRCRGDEAILELQGLGPFGRGPAHDNELTANKSISPSSRTTPPICRGPTRTSAPSPTRRSTSRWRSARSCRSPSATSRPPRPSTP